MDIEFHYHITYILARKGGFDAETSAVIAYASQYTDDNNDKYQVTLHDGTVFRNYISQTLNILFPKNKLLRIYSCFHFLPGDFTAPEAERSDCTLHKFNNTANSVTAQQVYADALESGDPYQTADGRLTDLRAARHRHRLALSRAKVFLPLQAEASEGMAAEGLHNVRGRPRHDGGDRGSGAGATGPVKRRLPQGLPPQLTPEQVGEGALPRMSCVEDTTVGSPKASARRWLRRITPDFSC